MTTPESTVLAAIDEALAADAPSAAAGSELRELEELALVLRADAPDPDAAFAESLGARVAAGFPRSRRLPSVRLPQARLPVLAGAASVLLALVVAVGILGDGEDAGEERPSGVELARPATPEATGDPELPAPSAEALDSVAPSGAAGGSIAPRVRERRIERSAQLTLATPGEELQETADRVVAVTDRHGGFVLRSSVSSGEDAGGGDFELRIPQERLQAALRDLSALGDVRARSEQGRDVTRAFTSTSERLEEARADRRGLLRRLELAQTEEQAAAIRRRLRLASAEIRSLERRLKGIRERVDYAVVSVTLVATDEAEDDEGSSGGIGDAFNDSLGTLEGSLEVALRALGAILPFALIAAIAWAAARALRRHRREATLT